MKVVICEDHPEQQRLIYTKLKNYAMMNHPSIEFVYVASSAKEVMEFIENNEADCYFLDINLGNGQNGLQLASEIRKKDVLASIIFVTDYSQSLKLTFKYKVAALDFIIKGTDSTFSEQLIEAFESSIERYKQLGQTKKANYFQLNFGEFIKNIPFENIYFFETSEVVHKIRLSEKNGVYEFYGKLKEIEEKYDHFFRCHKGYVINLEHVTQLEKKKRTVQLSDGSKVPVAYRSMKSLESRLKELLQ